MAGAVRCTKLGPRLRIQSPRQVGQDIDAPQVPGRGTLHVHGVLLSVQGRAMDKRVAGRHPGRAAYRQSAKPVVCRLVGLKPKPI